MKINRLIFKSLMLCSSFFLTSMNVHSQASKLDSSNIFILEWQIKDLNYKIDEMRTIQANQTIEKDLLKETYSNNYERINGVITLVLGVVGFFGFFGLRDISTIKREYREELEKLKGLQNDMTAKYNEFNLNKEKFDLDLKEILRTNEMQNNKFKVLELKDKIQKLFEDKIYGSALEYCTLALELAPDDYVLNYSKAMLHTRLRNYPESIKTFLKIEKLESDNENLVADLAEVYLLNNQIDEFEKLREKYSSIIDNKYEGKLQDIFTILIAYIRNDLNVLISESIKWIGLADLHSKEKRINSWVLEDILIFLANEPDSERKKIAQHLIWYIDGQLNGNTFLIETGIKMN